MVYKSHIRVTIFNDELKAKPRLIKIDNQLKLSVYLFIYFNILFGLAIA